MSLHGKSCSIVLVQLPPSHDRGVTGIVGVLEVNDGVVHLRARESENLVVIPPHLLERFEPATDELGEFLEIEFETELCLRAYYNGRRRLRTLGWNEVLAQATAEPPVE